MLEWGQRKRKSHKEYPALFYSKNKLPYLVGTKEPSGTTQKTTIYINTHKRLRVHKMKKSTHQVSQDQITQDILEEIFQVSHNKVEDVFSLLKSCERPEDELLGNVIVPMEIWKIIWTEWNN